MARNWILNYPCLSKHGDEMKLQSFNLKEILNGSWMGFYVKAYCHKTVFQCQQFLLLVGQLCANTVESHI